jgi:hypothetical protein
LSASATWSGKRGICTEAKTSSTSRQGSQLAITAKVSTGTVELRPHFTRSDSRCGLSAKSRSTSPQTKVRSSSTLEP